MQWLPLNFSTRLIRYLVICLIIGIRGIVYSQQLQVKGDQYLIGEEKKLEMIVHIWGEVKNPGSYRVADDTNVLELISIAGGPTEFSKISNVILTRGSIPGLRFSENLSTSMLLANNNHLNIHLISEPGQYKLEKRVIKINLKEYLEKEKYESLPRLQPGDILRLERNSWFRWQKALSIATQIAIVVQATYYFSRINY